MEEPARAIFTGYVPANEGYTFMLAADGFLTFPYEAFHDRTRVEAMCGGAVSGAPAARLR